MSLTSVLGIVAVSIILQCEAWPEVGQTAKSSPQCRKQADKRSCIETESADSDFTCAKLNCVYVTNETMCDFCKTYGKTNAIVYHHGREIRCQELEPGYPIYDDPECTEMHNSKSEFACSDDELYHCAMPSGWSGEFGAIYEDNRCEFCKKYGGLGYRDSIFYGTGEKCYEILPRLRPGTVFGQVGG